jgi:hypothetical protein
MSKNEHKRDRIGSILDSLDGLLPATPAPFLYTRIRGRMEARKEGYWSKAADFLSRPAVAMAFAIVFLMINGYILFSTLREGNEQAEEPLMAIAGEYDAHPTTFYETNPEAP